MRRLRDFPFAFVLAAGICEGAPPAPLTVEQVVELALQSNSQVRSAEARWYSAEHQFLPTFVPSDPTITYSNVGSPTNRITHPSDLSVSLSQALQFPGKGLLQ